MVHSKHFSLEEARSILISEKEKITEMIALKQQIDDLDHNVYRHPYFTGLPMNGEKYHDSESALVKIVSDFHDMGIQIKNIDKALLDFPHIRENGDEVYLCWMHGEPEIEYWHNIPDGFAGRKHISTL